MIIGEKIVFIQPLTKKKSCIRSSIGHNLEWHNVNNKAEQIQFLGWELNIAEHMTKVKF